MGPHLQKKSSKLLVTFNFYEIQQMLDKIIFSEE